MPLYFLEDRENKYVPIDVGYYDKKAMQSQQRFDAARSNYSEAMQEIANNPYIDSKSRNKYLEEVQGKFDEVITKNSGNLAAGAHDVMAAIEHAKLHPYQMAAKAQYDKAILQDKAAAQYGPNFILKDDVKQQSLYDEKTGKWLEPSSLKSTFYKAPDYEKLATDLMEFKKADIEQKMSDLVSSNSPYHLQAIKMTKKELTELALRELAKEVAPTFITKAGTLAVDNRQSVGYDPETETNLFTKVNKNGEVEYDMDAITEFIYRSNADRKNKSILTQRQFVTDHGAIMAQRHANRKKEIAYEAQLRKKERGEFPPGKYSNTIMADKEGYEAIKKVTVKREKSYNSAKKREENARQTLFSAAGVDNIRELQAHLKSFNDPKIGTLYESYLNARNERIEAETTYNQSKGTFELLQNQALTDFVASKEFKKLSEEYGITEEEFIERHKSGEEGLNWLQRQFLNTIKDAGGMETMRGMGWSLENDPEKIKTIGFAHLQNAFENTLDDGKIEVQDTELYLNYDKDSQQGQAIQAILDAGNNANLQDKLTMFNLSTEGNSKFIINKKTGESMTMQKFLDENVGVSLDAWGNPKSNDKKLTFVDWDPANSRASEGMLTIEIGEGDDATQWQVKANPNLTYNQKLIDEGAARSLVNIMNYQYATPSLMQENIRTQAKKYGYKNYTKDDIITLEGKIEILQVEPENSSFTIPLKTSSGTIPDRYVMIKSGNDDIIIIDNKTRRSIKEFRSDDPYTQKSNIKDYLMEQSGMFDVARIYNNNENFYYDDNDAIRTNLDYTFDSPIFNVDDLNN